MKQAMTLARHYNPCPIPRLLVLVLIASWACLAVPAQACTEDRVLDLVGRLEAPQGYDQVYSGVTVQPPRPITSMSVAEVLAWQQNAVRASSVSSAAGRYQIIRPTLQSLVEQGVVSPSARFDAATQDRLGRHLLRETGYRAGDSSVETANRIARVWAALPDLSTGRSAYEGVAGNHALITANSWHGVLACRLDLADVATETTVIREGARFGFLWDRALEEMASASDTVMRAIATTATSILLGLFLVDLVLRAGRWIFTGELPGVIAGFVARLLVVVLCLAVLRFPDDVLGVVRTTAFSIAGSIGAGGFVLESFSAGRMALVFSLFEGLMAENWAIRSAVQVLAVLMRRNPKVANGTSTTRCNVSASRGFRQPSPPPMRRDRTICPTKNHRLQNPPHQPNMAKTPMNSPQTGPTPHETQTSSNHAQNKGPQGTLPAQGTKLSPAPGSSQDTPPETQCISPAPPGPTLIPPDHVTDPRAFWASLSGVDPDQLIFPPPPSSLECRRNTWMQKHPRLGSFRARLLRLWRKLWFGPQHPEPAHRPAIPINIAPWTNQRLPHPNEDRSTTLLLRFLDRLLWSLSHPETRYETHAWRCRRRIGTQPFWRLRHLRNILAGQPPGPPPWFNADMGRDRTQSGNSIERITP